MFDVDKSSLSGFLYFGYDNKQDAGKRSLLDKLSPSMKLKCSEYI